jgi:hypothetical protein
MFTFTLILLFLLNLIKIDAQCECGKYIGTHCGDRKQDDLLRGDCDEDILYQCLAARFPAQNVTKCKFCQKGAKPGSDYCIVVLSLYQNSFILLMIVKKKFQNENLILFTKI